MNHKPLFAIAALALVVPAAYAQQSSSGISLGPSVGIYLPISSQIRRDLGTGAVQFGFGGAATGRPSEGSLTLSYSAIVASGNGNSLFILPITYGYEYHFGADTDASTIPYLRPFAGVAYYDYSITDLDSGEHFGTKRLGGTYGLEAGILIGHKIKLSASYNFFTSTDGFSFNGFSLAATYALFSL